VPFAAGPYLFPGYPDIPAPEFCPLGVETFGLLFVCASAGSAVTASENAIVLTILFIAPTSSCDSHVANVALSTKFPERQS